jgi:F420-non-reducing hydrogenase iron-sulfur subunit
MGVEPERLRFEYISASEGKKFADTVSSFVDQLKKIGPSPVKELA